MDGWLAAWLGVWVVGGCGCWDGCECGRGGGCGCGFGRLCLGVDVGEGVGDGVGVGVGVAVSRSVWAWTWVWVKALFGEWAVGGPRPRRLRDLIQREAEADANEIKMKAREDAIVEKDSWGGMGWGWAGWGEMGWDGMGWDGVACDGMGGMGWDGWDGLAWDGVAWKGMGWDEVGQLWWAVVEAAVVVVIFLPRVLHRREELVCGRPCTAIVVTLWSSDLRNVYL